MESAIAYLLGGANPIPLLPGVVFTFGRGRQNSVVLKDALVSRNHAGMACDDSGTIFLLDKGSSNKTFVNDKPIEPKVKVELRNNDRVRIGGTTFCVVMKNEKSDNAPQNAQPSNISGRIQVGEGITITPATRNTPSSDTNWRATKVFDPITATEPEEPPALAGQLSVQNLPQVLQFLNQNTNTGELFIKAPEKEGVLLFEKGNVFNAHSGETSGVEAIYELALLKKGSFRFTETDTRPAGETDVTDGMMPIVFECCRRADEAGRE